MVIEASISFGLAAVVSSNVAKPPFFISIAATNVSSACNLFSIVADSAQTDSTSPQIQVRAST